MIKVKLKFVIRNSSSKTPKKSGSILIVIQKLINSLMKMNMFFEAVIEVLEVTYKY